MVSVSDPELSTSTFARIEVLNVNDPPVLVDCIMSSPLSCYTFSIPENSPNNTITTGPSVRVFDEVRAACRQHTLLLLFRSSLLLAAMPLCSGHSRHHHPPPPSL